MIEKLPCTDLFSYFSTERFYFNWKATMCILLPWEAISMHFTSCAPKTREKDNKVAQELSHLGRHLPFRDHWLVFGENGTGRGGCLFQFGHASGHRSAELLVLRPASLIQVPTANTSSSRSRQPVQVRASTSYVFLFLHKPRDTIIHCSSHEKYANWWCFPDIGVKIYLELVPTCSRFIRVQIICSAREMFTFVHILVPTSETIAKN